MTLRARLCFTAALIATTFGLSALAHAQDEPASLEIDPAATDVEYYLDYTYDMDACKAPPLLTDLVKNLGHALEREVVGVTSDALTIEEEVEIGEMGVDWFRSYAWGGLNANPTDTRYLNDLLDMMLPFVERNDLPWKIHLVEDYSMNAFALPGGQLMVNSGLLTNVYNEAQLVGVLAHEIGHVELRHSSSLYQYLKTLGLLDIDDTSTGEELIYSFTQPFHSRDEADADTYAIQLMFKLGYSPHQLIKVFETFETFQPEVPNEAEMEGTFAKWIVYEYNNLTESHPHPVRRQCAVKKELELRKDPNNNTKFYVGVDNLVSRIGRPQKQF